MFVLFESGLLLERRCRPLLSRKQSGHKIDRAGARFVGMHPKTLERLARKGTVPGHPVGEGNKRKRWRFLISELDAWLRARRGQFR
ncbi:MAG: helix-turn-helix domain-containing protein [Acidobacteriaceae bacterium]